MRDQTINPAVKKMIGFFGIEIFEFLHIKKIKSKISTIETAWIKNLCGRSAKSLSLAEKTKGEATTRKQTRYPMQFSMVKALPAGLIPKILFIRFSLKPVSSVSCLTDFFCYSLLICLIRLFDKFI